ncbi:MAG: hypothetical protein V2I33_22765, partial [Kangiellaceae bacterium]|nr:hypothetical protein [Kangiellaceae bacterium]
MYLPDDCPKEFCSDALDGDFSVYTAVQYIHNHPEDQTYVAERKYISENRVPLVQPSNADYVASCLWVLYQCCISSGHKAILCQPRYLV